MRRWLLMVSVLAIFSTNALAQSETNIRNVCDTLPMSDIGPKVELSSPYYEETNWYGNPKTMKMDSSSVKRFESYSEFDFRGDKLRVPLTIEAGCAEGPNSTVTYATWNNSKKWVVKEDSYFTYIVDTHNMTTDEINDKTAYNMLILHKGEKSADDSYMSDELFVSKFFEFRFEWWLAEVSYEYKKDTIVDGGKAVYIGRPYSYAIATDSVKAVAAAMNGFVIPDTILTIRIQTVKAFFMDPRKPEPGSLEQQESVSSSSKTQQESSSSALQEQVSSSSKKQESVSSSSKNQESNFSSSKESKQNSSSSKQTEVNSSSSKQQESVSSSSKGNSSSSSAKQGKTSSSSEKSEAIPVQRLASPAEIDWSTAQVRRLDGSVVQNRRQLPPGVYYMKSFDGMWKKTAVY